jgi:chromosome partitioning protein
MHVLAIASRKGGSGKTTLTGHLSVEAERRGHGPVAIILETLAVDIERLRAGGIRTVIIDTPPAITGAIRQVVDVCDLVLIPTRPSPHDLRSVTATVALVENMDKPLVFVINAATPRARITREAITALSQHGPLAPCLIHQRVDFAASMIDGRTVMELPNARLAASEIERVWEYIAYRMGLSTSVANAVPRVETVDVEEMQVAV